MARCLCTLFLIHQEQHASDEARPWHSEWKGIKHSEVDEVYSTALLLDETSNAYTCIGGIILQALGKLFQVLLFALIYPSAFHHPSSYDVVWSSNYFFLVEFMEYVPWGFSRQRDISPNQSFVYQTAQFSSSFSKHASSFPGCVRTLVTKGYVQQQQLSRIPTIMEITPYKL